jgi:hypothetical protein
MIFVAIIIGIFLILIWDLHRQMLHEMRVMNAYYKWWQNWTTGNVTEGEREKGGQTP